MVDGIWVKRFLIRPDQGADRQYMISRRSGKGCCGRVTSRGGKQRQYRERGGHGCCREGYRMLVVMPDDERGTAGDLAAFHALVMTLGDFHVNDALAGSLNSAEAGVFRAAAIRLGGIEACSSAWR